MGSNEGEGNGDYKKSKWITKPYLSVFLVSLLIICIGGGSVLGWWLYKFHATNRQLWMVPFGFVFFLTPLIILISMIIPDQGISKSDEEKAFNTGQRTDAVDNSLSDPKK